MAEWKRALRRLASDETGVTSLEYALVASLIATVCVAIITAVGANVQALYTLVCVQITTAISGAPSC